MLVGLGWLVVGLGGARGVRLVVDEWLGGWWLGGLVLRGSLIHAKVRGNGEIHRWFFDIQMLLIDTIFREHHF